MHTTYSRGCNDENLGCPQSFRGAFDSCDTQAWDSGSPGKSSECHLPRTSFSLTLPFPQCFYPSLLVPLPISSSPHSCCSSPPISSPIKLLFLLCQSYTLYRQHTFMNLKSSCSLLSVSTIFRCNMDWPLKMYQYENIKGNHFLSENTVLSVRQTLSEPVRKQ